MFLIDAIKPNVENKLVLFYTKVYKIKSVLFLFVFGLLAVTKTVFKRNEKILCNNTLWEYSA